MAASADIFRHDVGNALVLHAQEQISPAALGLAMAIHEDPDNHIVVLDLPDDLPADIWSSVAGVLKRHRHGIRLVLCGPHHGMSSLAGQWLSDRLSRTVIAPHGQPLRGPSGMLFVHAATDSGWIRFRPHQQPSWQAKRYPAPGWDRAAATLRTTSAAGAAEPIPGGIWIRDGSDPTVLGDRWQWLASQVPAQPDAMAVILGSPGTAPLPVDDVARFWRGLDLADKGFARFVQYGPVQLPDGEALGQRLADVLESPVVCFTGVPIDGPDGPRLHTVTADGGLGWQVFARELRYTPRPSPVAPAEPPTILSHRTPLALGAAVGPQTYRYADDALVEVVQSGLWLRGPLPPGTSQPRGADQVRSRIADPERNAVIIDDADPAQVRRLRELAAELTARLDPATRDRSSLRFASELATPGPGVDGRIDATPTYRFTAADLKLDTPLDAVPPGTLLPTRQVRPRPAQLIRASTLAPVSPAAPGTDRPPVPVPLPVEPAALAPPQAPAVVPPPAALTSPPADSVPVPPPVEPAALASSPAAPVEAAAPAGAAPTPPSTERTAPAERTASAVPTAKPVDPAPAERVSPAVPTRPPLARLSDPVRLPAEPDSPATAESAALSQPVSQFGAAARFADTRAPDTREPAAGSPAARRTGPRHARPEPEVADAEPPAERPPVPDPPMAPTAPANARRRRRSSEGPAVPAGLPDEPATATAEPARPTVSVDGPTVPGTRSGRRRHREQLEPAASPATETVDAPAVDPRARRFADKVRSVIEQPTESLADQLAEKADQPGEGEVERAAEIAFSPVPEPAARVLAAGPSPDERDWLRAQLGTEYDTVAAALAPVLPGRPDDAAIADSVAAHLYLAGRADYIDEPLRLGQAGEHVRLARCVAAGLSRLPVFRGAAVTTVELSATALRAVRAHRELTTWSFSHMLTELPADLPGTVVVLIWSMTARRTRLLEPDGDRHVDGRVIFLPGTSFRVLDAQEPTVRYQGRLLLRELSADEADRGYGRFDELALTSLNRHLEQRAAAGRKVRVGAAAPCFTRVPGLC